MKTALPGDYDEAVTAHQVILKQLIWGNIINSYAS